MTNAGKGAPGSTQTNHPMTLSARAVHDISAALNGLLADMFAMYLKTKNYHWHVSGPHFRDYHLLLDDQASQIFATTDVIAERVRKIGGKTLRSVAHVGRLQRVQDVDSDFVAAREMLNRLHEETVQLVERLRGARELCDEHGDVASASLLETWIDEAEGRAWFLLEATRPADDD